MQKPHFIHTVFFWLKEGTTEAQKVAFEEGLSSLAEIKCSLSSYFGPPAGTPREIVDNSYDYALNVNFDSVANHDAYQGDPIHHEFIAAHKDIWKRVQVFDNFVQ